MDSISKQNKVFLSAALISVATLLFVSQVAAQTVIATIPVGDGPLRANFSNTTNRVYVGNHTAKSMSVIDGLTNSVLDTIALQGQPHDVAVNEMTGLVYVVERPIGHLPGWVSVYDETTLNLKDTILVSGHALELAINETTNLIYVAEVYPVSEVSVVDGTTNTVIATIPVAGTEDPVQGARAPAVNEKTNRFYIADTYQDAVLVFDGTTNNLIATIPVGDFPNYIRVNEQTNRIYVNNYLDGSVGVIDGSTNSLIKTISIGAAPATGLEVNETLNQIYVSSLTTNNVSVIDGATNTVIATVLAGDRPYGMAVNEANSLIYVANYFSDDMTVITLEYMEDFEDHDSGGWTGSPGYELRTSGGVDGGAYLHAWRTGYAPNFRNDQEPGSDAYIKSRGDLKALYGSQINISYDGIILDGYYSGSTGVKSAFWSEGTIGEDKTFWYKDFADPIDFLNTWSHVSFSINTDWTDAEAEAAGWRRASEYGNHSWSYTLRHLDIHHPFYGWTPNYGQYSVSGIDNISYKAVGDTDGDGINNASDNCPAISNADQNDNDVDGKGDACDPDDDNDGTLDTSDNCQFIANSDQEDNDQDSAGDVCDLDDDNDGVIDTDDNCQFTANEYQEDMDGDFIGDVCDEDPDGDGVVLIDNCPWVPNPFQEDNDLDSAGDACDDDDDNDSVLDVDDNCALTANLAQEDLDNDNIGDACDIDIDGDSVENDYDNCPCDANVGQEDTDGDLFGDACDDDDDADGVLDVDDNCQYIANLGQGDLDGDGQGDVCDGDLDGDTVENGVDNCPSVANGNQYDWDLDGYGDVCDDDWDGDGVPNDTDECGFTELGVVIDPESGCTVEQLVPCEGPRGTTEEWKNHGKFVSMLAHTTNDFVEQGLITEEERTEIMSNGANSACGQ